MFVQVSSSYEVTPQKSVTVLWLRVQLHVRAIYFTPGAQEYGFDCNSSFSSALRPIRHKTMEKGNITSLYLSRVVRKPVFGVSDQVPKQT